MVDSFYVVCSCLSHWLEMKGHCRCYHLTGVRG